MIHMDGIKIDLISEDHLIDMSSAEKIQMILDSIKTGSILVLERGLTPEEEATLIQATMTNIDPNGPDGFAGIEIESYPCRRRAAGILGKLLGKTITETRLTVIGPANQIKTIKRDGDLISTIISAQ